MKDASQYDWQSFIGRKPTVRRRELPDPWRGIPRGGARMRAGSVRGVLGLGTALHLAF